MRKEDLAEKIKPLIENDPQLADSIVVEWQRDPGASWEQLSARAGSSLGRIADRMAMADATVSFPLADAFTVEKSQLERLLDPDSPHSWMTMKGSELKDAAIKAGYVKELPGDASEEERLQQRMDYQKFLDVLAEESLNISRAKAVRQYEETKLTKDPVGYAQKLINDVFFRTFSRRMKEQARRGQGPTRFQGMGPENFAALAGDIGANTMYGAGAGGILAGLSTGGLKTAGRIYGSDFAAGVLGGLADVANRGMNTEQGVMPYEYLTEPAVGGIANTLMAPGMLRNAAASTLSFMGAGRVGDVSRRGIMKKVNEYLDNVSGYPESRLADRLSDMDAMPKFGEAPLSPEAAKKVDNMMEIWNDGLTMAPGEDQSLFDALQALYESGIKDGKLPSDLKVSDIIASKLDDLEGSLKTAGASEVPAIRRQISYFENAKEMVDRGILEPEKMLHETEPARMTYENPAPRKDGAEFDLSYDKRGREVMQGVIDGSYSPSQSERSALQRKYPEFKAYNAYAANRPGTAGEIMNYLAKPAVTNTGMERFNRPDDSEEAITMRFRKLMEAKPQATQAAYEWKFDPEIPGEMQLTPEEREIVNQFRSMEQKKALR